MACLEAMEACIEEVMAKTVADQKEIRTCLEKAGAWSA
jgi:hypothetical protein